MNSNPPPELTAVLERHPAPLRWDTSRSNELCTDSGRILDANGETVCDFGIQADYDSSGGDCRDDVAALLVHAVNTLAAQQPAFEVPTKEELAEAQAELDAADISGELSHMDVESIVGYAAMPQDIRGQMTAKAYRYAFKRGVEAASQQPAAPPARTDAERIAWAMARFFLRIQPFILNSWNVSMQKREWSLAYDEYLYDDLGTGPMPILTDAARAIIDAAMDAGAREEEGR